MNLLLSFFMLSSLLYAQDFVLENGKAVPRFMGQVKFFKGKVYRKDAEGEREITHGERFKKNDLLITGEQSFARIQMIDDSVISLGPLTEFRIDEGAFTSKTERSFAYQLMKGQLTANVKNKAKAGAITFRTKYTTIGIRGTYIMMNAHKLKEADVADYALLEGSAEITDNATKALYPLAKGGRRTFIHREGTQKEKARELSPEEFRLFSAPEVNEEKEFKPFLPFAEESELEELIGGGDQAKPQETAAKSLEAKKPHWSENLKKLNEKLRENRKKR